MSKHRVLVADPIAEAGIAILKEDPSLQVDVRIGIPKDDLVKDAGLYEAIVVRSQTKIGADVLAKAGKLRVVGRAGVGVDNIDVEAATARGVIVMNTPGGNTISTAEHAFTLMMALARHIPQGHASVEGGKWERKKFEGVELYNKTLAVLGMGRIGSEFARRALAFGMRVVAYDPFLSASRANLLRVELAEKLEDALREADFITLHMPATAETHHMLDAGRLALCKKGVRIINCARGGLVDEDALLAALESGQVAGAAMDVYEKEPPPDHPLLHHPQVVLTPHLGASTAEAQENVGIEIARNIRKHLADGSVINAVNMPSIDEKTLAVVGPYLRMAEALGRLAALLGPAQAESFQVQYSGTVGELDTTLVTRAALTGFLRHAFDAHSLNYLNAPSHAKKLGLQVVDSKNANPGEFTDLIEVRVATDDAQATIAGSFFGGRARVVKINAYHVECTPEGTILMVENNDTPGIIGFIGTTLAAHGVNIADMGLARNKAGATAIAILNLDSVPEEALLGALRANPNILSVRTLTV